MAKERIFISYKRKDNDELVNNFLKEIKKETREKCWIDKKGIESGAEFENVIQKAIDEAEIVLFMMSDNSLLSEWTFREIRYAKEKGKRIVPISIDGMSTRAWFSVIAGNLDCINIKDPEQKKKLFKDIRLWLNNKETNIWKSCNQLISVKFQDGTVIQKNTMMETLKSSIQKIKCKDVFNLTLKCGKGFLIEKRRNNDLDEICKGYYIVKRLQGKTIVNYLAEISDKLNLGLTIYSPYEEAEEPIHDGEDVSRAEGNLQEDGAAADEANSDDFKKISLNGGDMLSKGRFAHAVVSEYIAKYPRVTFTELENVFRADFLGSGFRQYGIVHLLNDELNKWKDPQRRFFLEQDDVLTLSDGTEFVVCTQWTKYSIKYIVDIAKGEGWNVSVLGEDNDEVKDSTEGVQFPLNLMILPKEYGKSDFDKEFLEMIAAVVYLDEVKLQQMIDSQWYEDNLQNVMHAASRDIKLMPMSLHNIVQCWDICINSNMYLNLTLSNDDNRNVYSEKVNRIRKILKEHFVHSDDKVDFAEQKSLILGIPENLPSFKGLRQIDMELIKSVYNLDFEMTANMLSYGANPWIEIEGGPCVWDMVANNIYNIKGLLQQAFDNHSVSAQDCADTIALILACAAWNEMSMYMAGQCPFTTGKRKPKNMYGQHMAIYQSTAPGYVSPEIHVELFFNPDNGRATSYYITQEDEVKGLRTSGKDIKWFFEKIEENDFVNYKYESGEFFDAYENGSYVLTVVTKDGSFNRVQVGKDIVASNPIFAFVEKLADKAREKRDDNVANTLDDDYFEDAEDHE